MNGLRRSDTGSPAIAATTGAVPAGNTSTSISMTPRGWRTARVLSDERKESAVPFLERALAWFAGLGVSVQRVMTDNGSAYRSHHWRAACRPRGCATSEPSPTPRAPKARPSGSSKPACASGPTRKPTPPPRRAKTLSPIGWATTTHTALANRPPATRLGQTRFLGSIEGTAPSSRPGSSDDRNGGPGQRLPKATGLADDLEKRALKNGGDGAGLSDQQPVVGPETPVRIHRSCRKHSAVTRTQTRLLTIGIPHPAASIVDLSARHPFELPIGSDNEDLVCGACGMVALAGWSLWSTAERLVVDSQMLIRCGRCRTYNVVPTARLAEVPREALAMVHNRLRGLYIRKRRPGSLFRTQ